MSRIEKTVFISYRRSDVYTALAVYENLKNQGYDVFFDYRSISSGDFEQIITSNIRARAHFLLILTPTALERLNEPGDWLRREIETAIDEKRNIIPLFFKGFRFGPQSVSDTLTGKLRNLSRYNGLNVHEDYFDEAMQRLRTEYLNRPLDTVLHPVSTEVQKVVIAEQVAADKALEQIENVQELVKIVEEKPAREREAPQPVVSQVAAGDAGKRPRAAPQKPSAEKTPSLLPDRKSLASRFNLRVLLGIGALLAVASLAVAAFPALRDLIAPGVGSTKIGKDGMTLLYVPAGEFTMGNDVDSDDEKPVHPVTLDAFWIDKTEVTNKMYSQCVEADVCEEPTNTSSYTHSNYYGNSEFDDYPVIYVNWNMAKTYCEWADRRLPTEAEWEKAASWNDATQEKYTYPWGNDAPTNDLLNYKSEVGDTTKVGNYPEGASPYGALDMAGNVWELVSSLYQPYPYDAADGRESLTSSDARAMRGGSWNYSDYEVRSARRGLIGPTNSDYHVGFRCALSENGPAGSTPLAQAATETPIPTQTSEPATTNTPSLPTETSSPPTPTLGIGSTMVSDKDGMILLYVPASEFVLGSEDSEADDNEKPALPVYLDAFWIDQTEVTNTMYAKCVDAADCRLPSNNIPYYEHSGNANRPVFVSWDQAKDYCTWVGRRLPTEAEWEKAARGEDGRLYPWGNRAPNSDLLNYQYFVWGSGNTAEVGTYPSGASPYGALDMVGNVWEWTSSLYQPYPYSATDGREDLSASGDRVVRGGSGNPFTDIRASVRRGNLPENIDGFRCAMSATP